MTTRTLIFCQTCTRSDEAEGSKLRGWGQLTVGQTTVDVCPTCVASLHGWQGGPVLERHQTRARDIAATTRRSA